MSPDLFCIFAETNKISKFSLTCGIVTVIPFMGWP